MEGTNTVEGQNIRSLKINVTNMVRAWPIWSGRFRRPGDRKNEIVDVWRPRFLRSCFVWLLSSHKKIEFQFSNILLWIKYIPSLLKGSGILVNVQIIILVIWDEKEELTLWILKIENMNHLESFGIICVRQYSTIKSVCWN